MDHLRQFIVERRKELGLKQNEVARRAGMSGSWLSTLLSNPNQEMTLASAKDLARALNVSTERLVQAYEGRKPESAQVVADAYRAAVKAFLSELPKEMIAELLLEAKGPDKMLELIAEAKRKAGEQ